MGLAHSGGAGGETFAEYGGVDPSLDPELALVRYARVFAVLSIGAAPLAHSSMKFVFYYGQALRVSMMEERERQKRSEESNVGDSGAPMQTDQMHTGLFDLLSTQLF